VVVKLPLCSHISRQEELLIQIVFLKNNICLIMIFFRWGTTSISQAGVHLCFPTSVLLQSSICADKMSQGRSPVPREFSSERLHQPEHVSCRITHQVFNSCPSMCLGDWVMCLVMLVLFVCWFQFQR